MHSTGKQIEYVRILEFSLFGNKSRKINIIPHIVVFNHNTIIPETPSLS